MYPQELINKKPPAESRINLTLLVMILGFLALLSIGIMALSIFQQMYPPAGAAINKQLNYQGKLQDSGGTMVPDGDYDIKFSIYAADVGGTPLWTECGTTGTPTARTVTVTNGIFSVMLGDTSAGLVCDVGGTPASPNAINLKFDSDSYWLGVTVEADAEMTPRKHIGAAGYSFNADLLDALDTSNSGGSNAYVPVTDSSGNLILSKNFTVDTNTLFVDSTINMVGVGTVSPLAKLHVYAPASVTTFYSEDFDSAGTWTNAGTTVPPFDWSTRSEVAADSGTYYWAYNDGANDGYDTGGAIDYYSYSSSFDISTATSPVLDLKYMLNMEQIGTKNDKAFIEIVDGADPTTVYQSWELTSNALSWTDFSQTLSPWWGSIAVRVRIYTNSGFNNSGFGFRVDTVSVADSVEADAGYFQGRVGINTLPSYALDVTSSGARTINAANTASSGGMGGYFMATGTNSMGVFSEVSTSGVGVYGHSVSGTGGSFLSDGGSMATGVSASVGTAMMMIPDYNRAVFANTVLNNGKANFGGSFGAAFSTVNNYGIYATASSVLSSVQNWGGYFTATGDSSYGVQASVSGSDVAATNYGGHFTAAGGTGTGVYGSANYNSFGSGTTNYGGYFKAAGEAGVGVYGEVNSGVGPNYGGYFVSAGSGLGSSGVFGTTSGKASGVYGVHGTATNTGAYVNYGGYFEAAGEAGMGVYGYSSNSAVAANYGGYFTSAGTGTGASGVFGSALGAADNVYGVQGVADSTGAYKNYGGWFYAKGTGIGTTGVYGLVSNNSTDDSVGVNGVAQGTAVKNYGGVFSAAGTSTGTSGVWGYASGSGQVYGVQGTASDTIAKNYGGYFEAYGTSSGSAAVYGRQWGLTGGTYGGEFISSSSSGVGVRGAAGGAGNVYGVLGDAGDTGAVNNVGGYFLAYGTAGSKGVWAYNGGTSGTNYGVYSEVLSTTGWAGYFTGGYGVYADAEVVGSPSGGVGGYMGAGTLNAEQLCIDGVCKSTWPAGGSGSPGGLDTYVQYNDGGAFGGDSNFIWTKGTQELEVYGKIGINLNPAYPLDITTSGDLYGAEIINAMAGGTAVYGNASSAAASVNYGGYFTAAGTGDNTAGVYGEGSDLSAMNSGGWFVAKGGDGSRAVFGHAENAGNITTTGGAFYSASVKGRGVYGYAYNTTGQNYGGYFQADGSGIGTTGVYGVQTDAGVGTGTVRYGGLFEANHGRAEGVAGYSYGPQGVGVHGVANDTTVGQANWAGYFESWGVGAGSSGVLAYAYGAGTTYGVRSYAQSAGAVTNYGGWFSAYGQTGYGVYGEATSAVGPNYGGYFTAAGTGTGTSAVYGSATGTTATTNYGGYFTAAGMGTGTVGVIGRATDTGAVDNFGGYFTAAGSGGGATGVYGEAFGTGAVINYGVSGVANGTATNTAGVYGRASGAGTVYGVRGSAQSTGAVTNYGGYFTSEGQTGIGVFGHANNSGAVTNYGVYGRTNGTGAGASGVYGTTGTTATGQIFGIYGRTESVSGRAVVGEATAGAGVGGYFTTAGTTANTTAVYGASSGTGAVLYGVYGTSLSTINNSAGVYGGSTGTAGTVFGVQGVTASSAGRGVYGYASSSVAGSINFGGYFQASGIAVGTAGVYGTTLGTPAAVVYGVQGTSTGTVAGAAGVRGIANGAGAYGVYGSSTSSTGYGVRGEGTGNGTTGVYGSATTGLSVAVWGSNTSTTATSSGVFGTASGASSYGGQFTANGTTAARAVFGSAGGASGVNYGGYFTAASTGGSYGVYGSETGATGTNYGVYGTVTSAAGWAGYFTGGEGVYTNEIHINDNTTGITYNRIGTTVTAAPASLTTTNDLLISGVLELRGRGGAGGSGLYTTLSSTASTTAVCSSLGNGAAPVAGTAYEIQDCSGAPAADYAEFYPAAADVAVGEIVVAGNTMVLTTDGDEVAQVIKSTSPYQNNIVGVISDPAKVTDFNVIGYNINDVDNPKPVSLNGRVMINVSDENGPIAIGDTITSSSVAGVGMRATKTGMILGYALDTWSGPGAGQIMVFVSPGWHANGAIASDGTANFFNDDFSFNKLGTADAVTTGYDSHVLTLLGSGWNGSAAENVAMKLQNTVIDSTNYKLSVINNAGTEVAYIGNDGSMGLSGKFYPASPTGFQTDAYIFYGANYMRTNADGWSTGSFDFAEMFKSSETLEPGDIVSVDGDTNEFVKKSSGAYDSMVLGIVSTKPGFLAGAPVNFDEPLENAGYPIALAGRVPTKVSIENGPIVPGDPLTSSSVPGVAMKATDPGMVIGVALEGWSNPAVGKIKVFVNLSWYGTNGEMTPISELASLTMTGNLDMSGNYILNVGSIVSKDEKWTIDENGVIKVKLTEEDTEKEMFGTTSPKVEMTISGTARLENGGQVVDLTLVDPDFVKNASPDTAYKILVTPNEDCNGIYVSERTPFGFTVRETRAGTSAASFDWMVVARRKGYDDPAPVVPPAPPAPAPSEPPAAPPSEPAPETPPAPKVPPVPETPPAEEPAPEVPPTP